MAHQNMIGKNPLVNNFNTFQMNNQCRLPFESNNLIKENIHVMNHANYALQVQRMNAANRGGQAQQQSASQSQRRDPFERRNLGANPNPNGSDMNETKSSNVRKGKGVNLIEEMLKPQKIKYVNTDVLPNYQSRIKESEKQIDPTLTPYKIIMKDKMAPLIQKYQAADGKAIRDKLSKEDLIVHKTTDEDKDEVRFNKERREKKIKMKEINKELEIEYCPANLDRHKEKYEYNQNVIRNLAHEECATGNDTRTDYVEFYKKKLAEDEKGIEKADSVLRKLVDTGIIRPEELPTANDDTAPPEEKSVNTLDFEKKIRKKTVTDKPVVKKPTAKKPTVKKPDVTKPDVSKPDVSKPDVTKPDVIKPIASKPAASKPTVSKPTVSKPIVTKPTVT